MMHEARTDYCMLLGRIFLLITGPGGVSPDTPVDRTDSQFG